MGNWLRECGSGFRSVRVKLDTPRSGHVSGIASACGDDLAAMDEAGYADLLSPSTERRRVHKKSAGVDSQEGLDLTRKEKNSTRFRIPTTHHSTYYESRFNLYHIFPRPLYSQVQLSKFILCDFPVQISLVSYFLNWYDRAGMRCQLCLFDEAQCQPDNIFHLLNVLIIFFILTSAVVTSLLLLKFQREKGRRYSDDEVCMIKSLQLAAVCVAILPFSTGFLMINREQILIPAIWYMMLGLPCFVGWVSVVFLFCYPFLCMLEDDPYY